MPRTNRPQPNIISLEDDAGVPDIYGLERFMEEVNVLELEGIYFCPDRKEAGRRSKQMQPLTLGEMADRPVTIVLSAYGQPAEHTYKVLQATFYKLYQQGPNTTGWVTFSRREISRLTGTSTGGPMLQRHYTSIKQLRNTEVNCYIQFKERKGDDWQKTWRLKSFSLFIDVGFEGSERGRFSQVSVRVHDVIVQNIKNRHISYFNWERMQGLDIVGMMLYKRFFRHMANIYREGMDKNKLMLERDYEAVCKKWLSLTPQTEPKRILKQLGKHLQALKDVRLLREWRIEPRATGSGFKIVAYAGQGFFSDYEKMYVHKQPSPETSTGDTEPLRYLIDFHRRLGHDQEEFSSKEVEYVRKLLSRYGDDGVRDFIAFGIEEAPNTKYDMQTFGALSTFEGKWKALRAKRLKAQERRAAIAACGVCNEVGMLEFENGAVAECPHEPQQLAIIHGHKPIRRFRPA